MLDWLPAIKDRWARLTTDAGPLWLMRAPAGQALPVCVVVPVSDVPDYSSDGAHVREIGVQFSVFHTSAVEAERIADRIADTFHDCELHVRDGYFINCRLIGRTMLTETEDEEAVFHAMREFQIHIGHD